MSTILRTGFEPFGDNKSNPSQQIAERLHGAAKFARHIVEKVKEYSNLKEAGRI